MSAQIIPFTPPQPEAKFPIGKDLEDQLHWVGALSHMASMKLADAECVLTVMRDQLKGIYKAQGWERD